MKELNLGNYSNPLATETLTNTISMFNNLNTVYQKARESINLLPKIKKNLFNNNWNEARKDSVTLFSNLVEIKKASQAVLAAEEKNYKNLEPVFKEYYEYFSTIAKNIYSDVSSKLTYTYETAYNTFQELMDNYHSPSSMYMLGLNDLAHVAEQNCAITEHVNSSSYDSVCTLGEICLNSAAAAA